MEILFAWALRSDSTCFRSGRLANACCSRSATVMSREGVLGQTFLRLVKRVRRHSQGQCQLRTRQGERVLRLDKFLLPRGCGHLGAEQIGVHSHAAFHAGSALLLDGLRGLQGVLRHGNLLLRQQHAVVGLHRLDTPAPDRCDPVAAPMPAACTWRELTPYQLCRPSKRLHCPEKRLEKLPIGVGVFSWLSAKSASGKALLPQPGAENEHGIVAAHRALGKHDLRHQRRA